MQMQAETQGKTRVNWDKAKANQVQMQAQAMENFPFLVLEFALVFAFALY